MLYLPFYTKKNSKYINALQPETLTPSKPKRVSPRTEWRELPPHGLPWWEHQEPGSSAGRGAQPGSRKPRELGFVSQRPRQQLAIARTGPKTERLTILHAVTHVTERGDHDFCLSRSHYTDTDTTSMERARGSNT